MARRFVNQPPAKKMSADAPKDAVKVEFARRLQAAMHLKGWNQSDLSREAQKHMPPGKHIGRDSVSHYIRAKVMPGPIKLEAICAAVGMKREDLVPVKGYRAAGDDNPALDVKDLGDGNLWLRINRAVRFTAGAKILQILAEEDDAGGSGDDGETVRKRDDGNPGSHMAVPA